MGTGPAPAEILACAEGPGEVEAMEGVPLVGASGLEFDRLLRRAAKVRRDDIFVTNLVRYRTDEDNRDPTEEEVKNDEPYLQAEIAAVNPRVILSIGRLATAYFLGVHRDVIDFEKVRSIPHESPLYPGVSVFPVLHPAAGIHQADRYAHLLYNDFERFGLYLRGYLWKVLDEFPEPQYQEVPSFCSDAEYVAVDTEGWIHRPWGLSASDTPGTGFVVKNGGTFKTAPHTKLIMHYGLHDLPVLNAMGVKVDPSNIEDTNIQAYLLGIEPKRLKCLAYKHCGMEMDEYEEVTREAEERVSRGYLEQILSAQCGTCEGGGEVTVPYKRQPKCKECDGSGVEGGPVVKIKKRKKKTDGNTLLEFLTPIEGGAGTSSTDLGTNSTALSKGSTCILCSGTGKQNKTKIEKCPDCNGDGTTWERPTTVIIEEDNGSESNYNPQSVGRRVRGILKSGTGFRSKWEDAHEAVKGPVEAVLGRMPITTLDEVADQKRVIDYASRDSDATLRVFHSLNPRIDEMDLRQAYEIDKAIVPIISRMQSNGILIDKDYFSDLGKEFEIAKREKKDLLQALVGYRLNPASSKQVGELLYRKLQLKAPKKTKKGDDESTEEKALQMLTIKYADDERVKPIVEAILDYRELHKMLGTYIYPIPRQADKNNRVHTQFSITRTSTGRVASSNPNLSNIPTRTELGKRIRNGFLSKEGTVLLSVDLDQIELRVCAHLSQDQSMIDAFVGASECPINIALGKCKCHDIHRATGAKMFNVSPEEVTDFQRGIGKKINFGVLYGMSENRLMNELALEGIRISKQEAKHFLQAWFKAYPGVTDYMEKCYAEARSIGYVRTMFGHIRYLPNVHSVLDRIREEALRQAGNAPIQGSAADIFKIALKSIDTELPEMKLLGYCEPLLNIYDEVIFEVQEEIAEPIAARIEYVMSHAVELLVPLGAKGNMAKRWGDLK
jgi:uracil-DNA glycosylase family 4